MYDRDQVVAADMRVSITVCGRAMSRPARMTYAQAAWRWMAAQMFRQAGDTACSLSQVHIGAGQCCQPGAIVTAVFEPAQSLYQDWLRFLVADITHDSAHSTYSF